MSKLGQMDWNSYGIRMELERSRNGKKRSPERKYISIEWKEIGTE